MKQIRSNSFETNSSSSHSLIITKGDSGHYTPEEAFKELYWMENDGTWDPSRDLYFGRSPFQVLSSFSDKLRYAYANAPLRKGTPDKKWGGYHYYRQYCKITNVVKEFFGNDIIFKGLSNRVKREESIGTDDGLLFGWLKKADISLIEFLTNKNIFVICDGDEYCIWTDMKKFGLIDTSNIKLAIPEKEWWEEDIDESNKGDVENA